MFGFKKSSVGMEQSNRLAYKNPVERLVKEKATVQAKDFLTMLSDTDLTDTRMYNSKCTLFDSQYGVYDDVLLLPYKENVHIPVDRFFEHWAYDKYLNPITLANHYKPVLKGYRDHSMIPHYPFKQQVHETQESGLHYYMGLLNPHYGHLIQEAITRIWLALDKPNFIDSNTKFVFHVFNNAGPNILNTLFSSGLGAFFEAIGIQKSNVLLVNKPMLIERLIVPETAIAISDGDCFMSDNARRVWTHVNRVMSNSTKNKTPSNSRTKIYLSRAAVKNPIQGRVLVNEQVVEHYFTQQGYRIVIPEQLTQHEMQRELSNASVIVGNPGSGLQNAFFIPHSASTLGLTCKPIIQVNPGLNHQIHTDIVCGHKTYGYCSDDYEVGNNFIHWKLDVNDLHRRLQHNAPEFLA